MALLVSPATYVTLDDFKAMPLDYDLTSYSDAQLTDILVRASGMANSIMRWSLLAEEREDTIVGDGTNQLFIGRYPLIYVRKIQLWQPGGNGYLVPLGTVRIDARIGTVTQYAPIAIAGIGLYSIFPEDWPIKVVYGYGYGFNPVVAPQWSAIDVPLPGATPSPLAPGTYQVGVTARTQFGETAPRFQTITTATGAIAISIQPTLGADSYRVFVGSTQLNATFVAETPSTVYAGNIATVHAASSAQPTGYFAEGAPIVDSSTISLPQELREAIRLLAMQVIYEQNNLANRGVYRTRDGMQDIAWRSTEGNSGRGVPLYYDQAIELLQPLKYQGCT